MSCTYGTLAHNIIVTAGIVLLVVTIALLGLLRTEILRRRTAERQLARVLRRATYKPTGVQR